MGRRFLLILGILLSVMPAPSPTRAQDRGVPTSPDSAPASPSELALPTPPDPRANVGDLPAVDPAARPERGGLSPVPPLDPATGNDPSSPRAGGPSRPRDDKDLDRAGGAAERPAPGRTPASATEPSPAVETEGLPTDRLPAGKQSVAVTVDVQSPTSMNLNQPANVRLVIRNTGTADALQVRVRDQLPEGLQFLSSEPPPDPGNRDSTLSWSFGVLPAGSDKVIALKVTPVKTGNLEHGASVWFQTGSSTQTKVYQPRLRIEQRASSASVLKGHAVEFKIWVRNDGDGPARNVKVEARLSPGLRYGSGGRGENDVITDPIPVLGPGQAEELDPLVADAIKEGPASCTAIATSPDVIVRNKEDEARSETRVEVVEPKLEIAVSGPQRRCTDTVAPYEISVRNPGTAEARKVRVVTLVPPGVRLLAVPEGARYDQATRRLQWSFDTLEPRSAPRKLGFEVKVGDVGKYEVAAEALGTGGLKAQSGRLLTEVFGMPDVDLVVSERQRVVDVGGKTTFLIRLRNYGTKEATNIVLKGSVTGNLKFSKLLTSDGVPADLDVWQKGDQIQFARNQVESPAIPSLGPGKEVALGLEVTVTSAEPKFATLHVTASHDDLSGTYDDMAGVKVLAPSARPASAGGDR